MSQMLRGECIFSQSGALDFQNILGSIVSFIAALVSRILPMKNCSFEHNIPFLLSPVSISQKFSAFHIFTLA